MIVIIKHDNITYIEHYKWKFIAYWLCLLKWKIKGAKVSTLKESEWK